VVFTTRYRPVKGARGFYRANIKHGVSPLLSGTRYTRDRLSRRALEFIKGHSTLWQPVPCNTSGRA
jgi:hypothetical protein